MNLTKLRGSFYAVVAMTCIAAAPIANAQSLLFCNGVGMAPAVSPASSYYVGDSFVLAVQNIPGNGIAEFYYQYGSGQLQFVANAGNFTAVSVPLLQQGQQNLRAVKTGYADECSLIATVHNQPTAAISSINGNYFTVSPLSFNGTVSGGAGGNTYLWTFGDGETSTDFNPTHSYNNTGTYQVTFKVTDQNGRASAAATQSIAITANPNVPGAPTNISHEFLNCPGGYTARYLLDWDATGPQPAGYHEIQRKIDYASDWGPTYGTSQSAKIVSGFYSNKPYVVRIRSCVTSDSATCGPWAYLNFWSATCGGGGGGGPN